MPVGNILNKGTFMAPSHRPHGNRVIRLVCAAAVVFATVGSVTFWAGAQQKKAETKRRAQEDGRLRQKLEDEHAVGADLWIYNDIPKGLAEARRQGKPLFVTFRCVPCQACAAFDADVALGQQKSPATRAIEKLAGAKFVCVRQVEMKGVDLNQFQFDHDLNWAAMFIHPNGTVYARYGTQSAAGPDAYNSLEGLEKTMRRVLQLHEAYPANAQVLSGKRGPKKPYKTALQMPGLKDKERYQGPTTRRNCIHCHNIHDAQQQHAQETGTFSQEMLWRYPLPKNLGLEIDPKDGRRIVRVIPKSPSAQAGLQRGEEITTVDGQAITSIADIQWALHQLSNKAIKLQIAGSRTGQHQLELPAGWKKTDISWRGSIWSLSPRLRVWTPPLTEQQRRQYKIPAGKAAYLVRWINTDSPGGRSAQKSGLRTNDVIVAFGGEPLPEDPRYFNLQIKLNYKVGDLLPLTVLRGGQEHEVQVKLAE